MTDSLDDELAQRAAYHGVSFTPKAVLAARYPGHFPQFEEPDTYTEKVATFVRDHTP